MAFVFVFIIVLLSFFVFIIVSHLIFLSFIERYRQRGVWECHEEAAGMSGGSWGARVSYSAASFVFIFVFCISISFSIIKCDR